MGRPWIRLWRDRLLASSRWRRLNLYQHGVYLAVLLRADEHGALRTGSRAWTVADLQYDLGGDRRRTARLQAALDLLVDVELLAVDDQDGALLVQRWHELQAPGHRDTMRLVSGLARSKRAPR